MDDDESKIRIADESLSESPTVISAILPKVESPGLLEEYPIDKSDLTVEGSIAPTISVPSDTSPLNISHIELPDGGILLENSECLRSALENGTIHLEVAADNFHNLAVIEDGDSCDAATKFIDGQAVRLEDGSMAFLHSLPKEGLQPVQFEDGTLAYLSHSREDLFNGEASGLGLDSLASAQISSVESLAKKNVQKTTSRRTGYSRLHPRQPMEKTFHCPYDGCTRVYTTQHHLKVHERSHTGDRPFKCMVTKCGKAFATGYGLKSHTRVHTGETPYKCSEFACPKAFKTSGDLQKHLRTHTGERPFKCPIEGCERAFTTSNIRKVHVRTHTGERPYVCESCGRAFASATNFKNHNRIHTGEKPYSCKVPGCTKKFTEYSSLYKHNVVHTRDKPYTCKLCGKHYRQTSTLAMHERTSHRKHDSPADVDSELTEPILDFDVETDISEDSSMHVKKEDAEVPEVPNEKGSAVISLENETNSLLQESSTVYALQLQQDDGSPGDTQQILLVTDPTQIAALQQLTEVQMQNILDPEEEEMKKESSV